MAREPDKVGDSRHRILAAGVRSISIRFNTNRPEIFYEAIAARLAEIVGNDLRPAHTDPIAYYEEQCRTLIGRALSRGRRTLIVIDGADEALGESFGARWFPRQGENTLRLIVSARLQIGDVNSRGWVRRLGWDSNIRYSTLELASLDFAGVKSLLVTTGAPLDTLAARPDVVDKLHSLSEGEPLVLQLYVEDLWSRGQSGQELTIDDLDHIRPGLSGYFEDWLHRQQDIWREDRKDSTPVDSILLALQLSLLACAHGPLSAEDIGELLRQGGHRSPGLRIEDGLYPLRRFVIGTGRQLADGFHGYVLSHPRFGQFLREDYLDTSQVAEARAALARWGEDIVRRSDTGELPPEKVTAYVLNYHSQHLVDAGFSSGSFMMMLERGWLRACEMHEGGYRGFSKDVTAALHALLDEQPRAQAVRSSLIRCALFQTSVVSLVSQMPEDVLSPCVHARLISVRQALHWLEFHVPDIRVAILVRLAPMLDEASFGVALQACRSIADEVLRARALAAVAARLDQTDRHAVVEEVVSSLVPKQGAWESLLESGKMKLISETIAGIAEYLSGADLAGAIAVANAMAFDENRVTVFFALAAVAPADERPALLRQAWAAFGAIRDINHHMICWNS